MSLTDRECPVCACKDVPMRGPHDQLCTNCRHEQEWLAATGEHKTAKEIAAIVQAHGIKTSFVYPPIPIRSMDWAAFRDNDEPDDDGHMLSGSGPTEMAAVASLVEALEDRP